MLPLGHILRKHQILYATIIMLMTHRHTVPECTKNIKHLDTQQLLQALKMTRQKSFDLELKVSKTCT